MRFERLTTESGLSQGTVNYTLQDASGLLWIGTQGGLNRYDGYRFEVYRHDPSDPASVPHDWVTALAEDPSGDLWVGTEGGGLSRWRRATDSFQHYRHDPNDPSSLSGHRVIDLAWDVAPLARGRKAARALWIATLDAGLNRLEPDSGSIERFRHDPSDPASLPHDQLGAVHVDRDGTLWVGTWGGLARFEPSAGEFRHYRHDPGDPLSLSDDRVRAVVEDARGRLWIGTHHGLNRLAAGGESFERFLHDPGVAGSLSHDWVRSLFEDSDGRLWVGTDGGLNLWREKALGFAAYRADAGDPESLGSDIIMHIAQDRSGVLWVGTLGGGLGKWNPSTWSFLHHRAAGDGGSNNVFAISEDPGGGLWIGTLGSGLERVDRDTGRRERFGAGPGGLGDDRVTALLHDRGGALWVGTLGGGLSRFDPRSGSFESHRHDSRRPDSLSNDAVTVIYQDRRDRLWAGTWIGGLNRYLGEGAFKRLRHDPGEPRSLGIDRVFSLAEDAAGRLWVATDGGGLNLWREEGEDFLRLTHDPDDPTSLSDSELVALHADAAGRLWIGTKSGGLDRLVSFEEASGRAVFENYSSTDGLPGGSVWGILSDEFGHVWLSTNGGLSRFDPESRTFKNFDTSHGLQSNEFNQGAYYRSASGELFFGGVDGFNAFFPDRIRTNTAVPPVILTGLSRFNEPLDFGRPLFDVEEVALSYKDHFLAFEFAALDFTAPEKNRYRYRLEGFDRAATGGAWVDLGTERRVTFASMVPGSYRLRVQGANNDGVWNQEGLALEISVAPPFWQTWWFRSLTMFLATSAFLGAYHVRTRAIRNRNILLEALVKERTRELEAAQEQLVRKEKLATLGELAGSLAHEIRNPLGVIKNASYLLNVLRPPDDEDIKEQLDQIDQEVEYSSNIIGELLDFAREPAAGRKRFALQDAVAEALEAVEVPASIEVERRLDGEPLVVHASGDQVRSILVNLVQNAVQAMAGKGTLRLECHHARSGERDEAYVSVIDTGSGIAADQLEKIFEPLFTTKARGIGLGLSLSKRYAELNGGRIECDSEEGQGSIFRLVLPLAET